MDYYTRFDTPLCEIILAGNEDGLTHLHLHTGKGKRHFEISGEWIYNDAFFSDITSQINEYIEGTRKNFQVVLNPQGTDFQKKVWDALCQIPIGEIRTYRDIAGFIGNSNASRAVGMANSKNPIPLIIPCHRVIGTNGKLVGFAHGLEIKEKLIRLEEKYHGQRPSETTGGTVL